MIGPAHRGGGAKNAGASVMRKASAPGAVVAAVVAKVTHLPAGPAPDRGRCRKDSLVNAPVMARSSRLFFSVLIAERLLHQRLTGVDRTRTGARGSPGRAGWGD